MITLLLSIISDTTAGNLHFTASMLQYTGKYCACPPATKIDMILYVEYCRWEDYYDKKM